MHNSLYRYSQFNTFDELEQSGIFKYCLTPDLAEKIRNQTPPPIDPMPSTEMPKLDNAVIETQIQEITTPTVVQTNLEESSLPKNTRYSSRKPDTLFWSIFIAHYGVDEFTEIGSKYMNREMEEKMRVVEFIKKNRPRMKSMKITAATGEEMMGDLLTNQSTSMLVLPALALFYETRIWIVSEETNTYLEYLPNQSDSDGDRSIMIIYRDTKGNRVSYTTETTDDRSNLIEKIEQTMIRIENIEHPFKGISTYKLADLEEIARKLNLQIPSGTKSDVVSTHFTLDNRKVEDRRESGVKLDVVSTHFTLDNRKVEDRRESGVKWKKNDWYVAISRHAQLGWLEPTRTRKPRDK